MSVPSLRALRAFAETTRGGSLAAASRALHVTPSAVSHLLRELEQTLSVTLFASPRPNGRLTEAGEELGRRLVTAFDMIDLAVTEARYQAGDVRVSALSSFLTLWLVPRLTGFQSRYPDTRLLLTTGTRPVDLAAEPFECAIRWGRGDWPGLEKTLLFRDCPGPDNQSPLAAVGARATPPRRPHPSRRLARRRRSARPAGRSANTDFRDAGTGGAGGSRGYGCRGGGPQPDCRHDRRGDAGGGRTGPSGSGGRRPLVRCPAGPPAPPAGQAVPRLVGDRGATGGRRNGGGPPSGGNRSTSRRSCR